MKQSPLIAALQRLSRWLAANASLTVIAAAIFSFFFPQAFAWVRGNTQTVILGIIMLTIALPSLRKTSAFWRVAPSISLLEPVPNSSSCPAWPTFWCMSSG